MNKISIFSICLPLSLIALPSMAVAKGEPLFGIATVGQTTLEEMRPYLEAHNCNVQKSGAGALVIESGCYKLPGNPSVKIVLGPSPRFGTIAALTLQYHPDAKGMVFTSYVSTLQKAFGKPTNFLNLGNKGRVATWDTKTTMIGVKDLGSGNGELVMILKPEYAGFPKGAAGHQKTKP